MAGQKTPTALGTESIGKLLMQYAVQLGQIENGVNEGAVLCNVKTAFSFTPSSIVT